MLLLLLPQIKSGRWAGPEGKSQHITQYHDVISDALGRHVGRLVQAVVVVSLFGTNVRHTQAPPNEKCLLGGGAAGGCWCFSIARAPRLLTCSRCGVCCCCTGLAHVCAAEQVSQIVASSSDAFYLAQGHSKR